MTKKLTVMIPEEIGEDLKKFADERKFSLSAAITASIQGYLFLVDKIELEDYYLVLEKIVCGNFERKEIEFPTFSERKNKNKEVK